MSKTRRWNNSSPGLPLRSTRVDEEPSIPLIKFLHLGPKPLFCKISNKKTQETESNALEISNFKSIRGCFCWWRNFAVCWTKIKLSLMQRPLTNALWLAATIALSFLDSRLAINLVTSLAKLWMRLIGRKSLTWTASSFLGNNVRSAVLSRCRFLKFPRCTAARAAITSGLMVVQHNL